MYAIPVGFPPDYMKDWHMIWWIAIIGIMYLFAIILLVRVGRAETPITKWIFRAFSWFLWLYGITNITIILSIWYPDSFDFWQGIANFAGLLSLVPGIAVLEKYLVPKTHRVLTVFAIIINGVDLIILLFFPDQTSLSLLIAQVGAVILLATIIMLYFVFIHQSTGTIRRQAIITVTGIALCAAGAIFNGYQILELGIPLWAAPLLFTIGVVFIGTSLKISKEA